jgi:hypothetical protein
MLSLTQSIVNPITPERSFPSERFWCPKGPRPYNIGCPPVTGTTAPEM